jgi:hypothetical protein
MNEPRKKRLEKLLSPETEKTGKELDATGGFVEVGNHPFEKLRRGLRSIFPGMPDIVLSNKETDEDE